MYITKPEMKERLRLIEKERLGKLLPSENKRLKKLQIKFGKEQDRKAPLPK